MESSDVRRRLNLMIDRARRAGAERRVKADEASRDYQEFLDRVAVPLFRQVAQALKAGGYPFAVSTPGGGVRLASDRSADDYIELSLDTTGEEPVVLGHTRRARGRRVLETERPIGTGKVRNLTDEQVLLYLLKELEPFVER
jgi:hypothetical protein